MDERNAIEKSSNEVARKAEISKQLMSIEFHPQNAELARQAEKGTKIPFAEIAALGTAFASVPESFRTMTQTLTPAANQLYKVILPEGATGVLKTTKAGKTYGFAPMADGSSKLAQLVPVDGIQEVTTTIPYDPTTLVVAMALMEINQKLDAIQETQQEMFEYLKTKDRAKQRADLDTLTELLNSYSTYWDNPTAKANNSSLAKDIKRDAKASIRQHRELIEAALDKGGILSPDKTVKGRAKTIHASLEELRIAVYLHSFASFMEAVLDENYSHDNLNALAEKIERDSVEYRLFYTKAYNQLEEATESTIGGVALSGAAKAFGALGRTVEKTPVGKRTLIDEALLKAEGGLEGLNKSREQRVLGQLPSASASDVRPFMSGLRNIDRLYNEEVQFLADGENIYLLPQNNSEQGAD